jgi:hypothetical protein
LGREFGSLMAENHYLNIDRNPSQPADPNRMACDIQWGLADPGLLELTETNSPGLTTQGQVLLLPDLWEELMRYYLFPEC